MDPNVNLVHKYAPCPSSTIAPSHAYHTQACTMFGQIGLLTCRTSPHPAFHCQLLLINRSHSRAQGALQVAHTPVYSSLCDNTSCRGAHVWGDPTQDQRQPDHSSQDSQATGHAHHSGPSTGASGQASGPWAAYPAQASAWGGPPEPSPAQVEHLQLPTLPRHVTMETGAQQLCLGESAGQRVELGCACKCSAL